MAGPYGFAVSPGCGHASYCGECAIRARKLFGDTKCPICKDESSWLWITSNLVDQTPLAEPPDLDSSGGFAFAAPELEFAAASLQTIACSECEAVHDTMLALKTHAHAVHRSVLCEICLEARPCFIREQRLYTQKQLSYHVSHGDAPRGNDAKLLPHERCRLCKKLLFDSTALRKHLRESHFACPICERIGGAHSADFSDLIQLTRHFRDVHFFCEYEECAERHFENVFESEFELQLHVLKSHPDKKGKQRQGRKLKLYSSGGGGRTPHPGFASAHRFAAEPEWLLRAEEATPDDHAAADAAARAAARANLLQISSSVTSKSKKAAARDSAAYAQVISTNFGSKKDAVAPVAPQVKTFDMKPEEAFGSYLFAVEKATARLLSKCYADVSLSRQVCEVCH